MFIRHSFSRFIESNTNFKNQRNFSLLIHIYEHKKQLLKTMFNICSTQVTCKFDLMSIHLKIVLPTAPWARRLTGLPQVRQPGGNVNAYVRSPVGIRKGSMFLRTRGQFFHSNIRITTPKGPPLYRGGVVCVFQWPVEPCRLESLTPGRATHAEQVEG